MDEQRVQAYVSLIQKFLTCPGGEELQILNQSMELLDEGFVQMCEQVAAQLPEEGQQNQAAFLRDLAQQLGAFLASQGAGGNQQGLLQEFWQQLLQAEMEGSAAVVHQVMRQNMGLIVPALGDTIAQWLRGFLAQHPGQAEEVAGLVENTCTSIRQFPYGRYTEALEIAIRGYEVVLELGADNPEKRAQTLTNLGNAYRTQAEFGINPAANLREAIATYTEAADIRRRPGLETDLADTLNNLGIARSIQAEMGINSAANLDQAISAYDEAAAIIQGLGLEKDLWATVILNNLGNARIIQAEMGINPAANLERAISAYNEAAAIRRELGLNKHLSTTLYNLGNARLAQAQMEMDPSTNLERAISAYNEAAAISQQLGLGKDFSDTLNNLGVAHRTQVKMGINPAANLDRAISAYNEAVAISQQLGLARDLATTLNNLGFAYQAQFRLSGNSTSQKQKALENAYRSFQKALEQVEYLRGEIGADSERYKRNFNEQWNRVYRGMVEVCLELGNHTAAIEYADRSKARNLTELIVTHDAYPGGEIPAKVRQRLQQIRQAISEEDLRLKQDPNPDYTHISQLRDEFQAKYPYKPLKFAEIQSLLNDETAILEWYILGDKFLTFTLTNETLNLWQSSEKDRQNLIHWTDAYLHDYRNNKTQWQHELPQRLKTLAQILHLDEILQNLWEKFPNCKKLILIPHRFLHLFPLHALPVHYSNNQGASIAPLHDPVGAQCLRPIPLQELFPKGVAYAPNCQVLKQAQNRPRPQFNQLFAIQNPTKDLDFTDIEVAAIQSLFNPHHILQYDAAEKAAILDGDNLKNAHCTHFSCHGYFNFEDALKSALLLAKSEFTPPPPSEDQSRYIPLQNGNLLDLGKCLTIEDILRLDLSNCRLVTLSACETGITDFNSTSDEYIGLPSGFILAGAPNVVCSLWAVNDLSTALLMIRFYQNVKNGETVPLALKQAQIWLRDVTVEGLQVWSEPILAILDSFSQDELRCRLSKMDLRSKPFASPYYWAGFCAIGV